MKEFVELILMIYAICPNSTPTARNLRKGQKNKATAPKTQVRAAEISSTPLPESGFLTKFE